MIFTEKAYGMPRENLEALYDIEARLPRTVGESSIMQHSTAKTEASQAIIEIDGMLFPKPNILTLFGFGTALSDIQAQIEQATNDPQIKKIILNFSSPGGSVTGVNELANRIKIMNKPIVAYVSGMAASAAYWLAAACDEIIVDATATLGSIGIIGIYSVRNNNQIEIVSSGAPKKRPDLETDEGRRLAQSYVDSLETVFVDSIHRLRPSLSKDQINALGGDIRVGEQAIHAGLADGLGSLQDVITGKPVISSMNSESNNSLTQAENGWALAAAKVNALRGGNQLKTNVSTGNIKQTSANSIDSNWQKTVAKFKKTYGR